MAAFPFPVLVAGFNNQLDVVALLHLQHAGAYLAASITHWRSCTLQAFSMAKACRLPKPWTRTAASCATTSSLLLLVPFRLEIWPLISSASQFKHLTSVVT